MADKDKKYKNDKDNKDQDKNPDENVQDNTPGVTQPGQPEPTAHGEEITNPKVRAQVGLPVEDTRARDAAAQPETSSIGPEPHTNQSHPEEDK